MRLEEIFDQLAQDMKALLSAPVGSKRIKITDLTPRDGQQCKLATRVTTDDLLPLCAALDPCGFYAVEVWGGASFDAALVATASSSAATAHTIAITAAACAAINVLFFFVVVVSIVVLVALIFQPP